MKNPNKEAVTGSTMATIEAEVGDVRFNPITELHSEKAHSFRGGMKAMSDTECQ